MWTIVCAGNNSHTIRCVYLYCKSCVSAHIVSKILTVDISRSIRFPCGKSIFISYHFSLLSFTLPLVENCLCANRLFPQALPPSPPSTPTPTPPHQHLCRLLPLTEMKCDRGGNQADLIRTTGLRESCAE